MSRSAQLTVVVAVADRSRASDWVVVEAVAVFERLVQPVTVPVTVIVTEAPAASVPRSHGNALDASQANVPPVASMSTPVRAAGRVSATEVLAAAAVPLLVTVIV